jgi:2-dehydro-3-deoxyphosphogluconate aldolase / (4S)-4-hydroxy-2-oxoglutarate aldolase
METGIRDRIRALGLIPVIIIDEAADALPLADALAEGGLACAEVTFRTPAAADALARITGERPDVLAGAGTVLSRDAAQRAREAGARFVVAPGLSPAVVEYCLGHGIPVFPGVCTPTEVEAALALGVTTLKFFPAEAMGGVSFLKAIAAPYGMVDFIPTGGITEANLGDYLALARVLACGGSWMAPRDWIRAQRFDRIRETTVLAVERSRAARAGG